jgi:hypothetical protein
VLPLFSIGGEAGMESLKALVGKDRNQTFASGLAGGLFKAAGKSSLELVAARKTIAKAACVIEHSAKLGSISARYAASSRRSRMTRITPSSAANNR